MEGAIQPSFRFPSWQLLATMLDTESTLLVHHCPSFHVRFHLEPSDTRSISHAVIVETARPSVMEDARHVLLVGDEVWPARASTNARHLPREGEGPLDK